MEICLWAGCKESRRIGVQRAGGGMQTSAPGVTTFIMPPYIVYMRGRCNLTSRKHLRGLWRTSHGCTGVTPFLVLLVLCCIQVKEGVSSLATVCPLLLMQSLWGISAGMLRRLWPPSLLQHPQWPSFGVILLQYFRWPSLGIIVIILPPC